MKNIIDCLIIGTNEMTSINHKNVTQCFNQQSASIREKNLNYVNYEGEDYRAPELIKKAILKKSKEQSIGSFCVNETISAAILYLGTAIHNEGLSFDFVNSFQSDKDDLIRILKENEVLSIAVTTTFYVNPWPVVEIIRYIRKYSKAPIIVGGPYIYGQELLGQIDNFISVLNLINADYYVVSPHGEDILCHIIQSIKKNLICKDIANMYYKQDGTFHFTFPQESEQYNLEEHRVKWDLFANRLGKMVTIRTSLSCPFSCAFCEYPLRAGKYRMLNLDNIEKELKLLNDIEGVESISFIDDTFNVPPERFKEISE